MDLNDVAMFVKVVRSGSFAEASRRIGIPPNTLSRRMRQLEETLGTRLMQRSTRKLSLTSAGREFYEQCADAVDGLAEAGQALISGSQEPSGLVRVAAMADFFDFFAMEWLADFLATYPRIRLAFVLSDGQADLIADKIDVAIRGGLLEDSSFIARQIHGADMDGLVASPAYLAARDTPHTPQDLANHDCLGLAHANGHIVWTLTGPDGHTEEVQVNGRFSGNTAQALRKATLAGLGVALLPPTMTRRDVRDGRLVRVLPEHHRPRHGLSVVYPSRKQLPLAVSAFIDLVMDKLSEVEELPAAHCLPT